ncbi:MAG: flagellar motor switch protein FliN [Spirochaetota bacterium]|nr:flagellar motor switch protein FliN [Spirochaetota bacterium]
MANGSESNLSQADIDALLSGADEDADSSQQAADTQDALDAALGASSDDSPLSNGDLAGLEGLLGGMDQATPAASASKPAKPKPGRMAKRGSELENVENMELLLDVKMNLSVEIGRTKKQVDEVLAFSAGTIVELDKLNGELVDIMVNNRLIARGEVVAVDESFGVKVMEIIDPEERFKIEL